MTAALRRKVIDSQTADATPAPSSPCDCDSIKEIAATAVGAAAGLTLAGAPLIAIGVSAVAAPLIYEGIKAVSRMANRAD